MMPDYSKLLERSFGGDHDAESELCEAVNEQLRLVAANLVRRYKAEAQPSSLVNEAFMAMFRGRPMTPPDSEHFFSIATEVMRQLLRERWRRNCAKKRGGLLAKRRLDDVQHLVCDDEIGSAVDFEIIDRELNRLRNAKSTRIQYKIIKYRFFGGLTIQQTADLLSLSKTTVEREWRLVRAKLRQRLEQEGCDGFE